MVLIILRLLLCIFLIIWILMIGGRFLELQDGIQKLQEC